MAIDRFSDPTRAWFAGALGEPTAAQHGAWDAIAGGDHALVVAPTGSGKTLAAFLWALDRLLTEPPPVDPLARCRVVYVSPLKALAADVERNLRVPLVGIRQAAHHLGQTPAPVEIGMRTGDTPPAQRRAFGRTPPDILITTPESLYLVLTSAARAGLSGVRTVILDEIHAVAGTKRGAHLALSLERLDALLTRPGGPGPAQRIGLSATVRPVAVVAGFLGGARAPDDGGRRVVVVQPPATKRIEVEVVVPVPDLTEPGVAGTPRPGAGAGPDAKTGPGRAKGPHARGFGGATAPDTDALATEPVAKPSVWPHVEERVVDLVAAHRSTLVFTNARRGAERLTSRVNEIWAARQGRDVPDVGAVQPAATPGGSGASAGVDTRDATAILARAHHGSMSRAERTRTESELKAGVLPAVVATSSLELGIDMGAVDLVVQVGAPPSVASGLQRIGRAGHQVGATSHGVVFPTFRGELVPAAVTAQRMREGALEALAVPANPLDVLAQQIVAMVAVADWPVPELARVVRRAAPFATLGDATLRAVLDMLAGRYPSEEFGELRPRLVWDRTRDVLTARPGALRLAVTSGGTIPDRGLYGVFLADGSDDAGVLADTARAGGRVRGGKRVGELDEEMVYESRVGDTFTLGSSTWRIREITADRVVVTPAPGLPGRLPFWKGDSPGRPAELGRAMGAWVRELLTLPAPAARDRVRSAGLDQWAADNLLAYLREQREATGEVPTDTVLVVERFRDELGDWRVVLHSPYGARVHAPWAVVLGARLRERYGVDAAVMHADDGMVLRLPDVVDSSYDEAAGRPGDEHGKGPGGGWPSSMPAGTLGGWPSSTPAGTLGGWPGVGPRLDAADLLLDPDTVVDEVRAGLGDSALFAARFREAAARALLLPRRRPDRRQPLWQQRQRAAQLLSVAAQYPDFPILLEATRECLQDDFDIAALATLMRDIAAGRVRVVEVTTPRPSPFAASLLFGYTAQFLYDGDAPLAERRAAALSLDPTLLAELLGATGQSQLADLLDPRAVERTEAELGALTPDRQATGLEQLADLLRRQGPLPAAELVARVADEVRGRTAPWLVQLERADRAIRVRLPGLPPECGEQWAAVEDAGRLRDALGAALPTGIPAVFTEAVPDPLGDLLRRHARTHGPFTAADAAARFGLGVAVAAEALARLVGRGVLVQGHLRPDELRGSHPTASHPTASHPTASHPTASHPAAGHPTGSHPAAGHPIGSHPAAGEPRPPGPAPGGWSPGGDYCDADVLRMLRRRSLAALRAEVEPVPPQALGVFLPAWQGVRTAHATGGPRGVDAVARVVEQLAGAVVPASALETWVLPSRVADYSPAMLDELTAAGEVIWAGHAALAGHDGLISLHPAAVADLTLPPLDSAAGEAPGPLRAAVLAALAGGAWFLPALAGHLRDELEDPALTQARVLDELWALVWAGRVTNDGLAPLRAWLGTGTTAHRTRPTAPRSRALRPRLALRGAGLLGSAGGSPGGRIGSATDPATGRGAGRWSLLPTREQNPTLLAHAAAAQLLDRHGIVTRAVAPSEGLGGRFADIYRVLSVLEQGGQVRRGYFVEHLGGSQFALPGAVDRLRSDASAVTRATAGMTAGVADDEFTAGAQPIVVVLAATDPANPYGAALAWPDPWTAPGETPRHRPGRKAGALVVLVSGAPTLYVERGGRTTLTFTPDPVALAAAADALAGAVRAGRAGRLTIGAVDGAPVLGEALHGALTTALVAAGFAVTPSGLRLRQER